jgi:hypothetical protein
LDRCPGIPCYSGVPDFFDEKSGYKMRLYKSKRLFVCSNQQKDHPAADIGTICRGDGAAG